jgi:hypothetical protein
MAANDNGAILLAGPPKKLDGAIGGQGEAREYHNIWLEPLDAIQERGHSVNVPVIVLL